MATVAAAPPTGTGNLRNYILVTAAYWADTLTDGAIRMLVLLYFNQQGYAAIEVAALFLFYEVFGIVTNLVGGWLAARLGLKATLFAGLGTQVVALGMLALNAAWLTVPYVMVAQALSGIAKDLTKMSSKSAIKFVVAQEGQDAQSTLFKWVAVLTGSKNALKGVGFFLGGLLLYVVGFQPALLILAGVVLTALVTTAALMKGDLGTANKKAKFGQMFANNRAVNVLAAARVFLFASRDVWFVVGLPVFLYSVLGWNFWQVGGFLAVWIIGYGVVQASAPGILRWAYAGGGTPDGWTACWLAFVLAAFPAGIALALAAGADPAWVVVVGLIAFGGVFAMNSAVHSYLILAYADNDKAAMNVGFYYMANACGRLAGTVLSGVLFQLYGLVGCLWAAVALVLACGLLSLGLPRHHAAVPMAAAGATNERRGGEVMATPIVLFLCTGNSARSQMAEAFLRRHGGDRIEVHSAGMEALGVHPLAVEVMAEVGIDISGQRSKKLRDYLGRLAVRVAITVCHADEANCPIIWPSALTHLAWPFPNPAAVVGTDEERRNAFRKTRDEIDATITRWLDADGWAVLEGR